MKPMMKKLLLLTTCLLLVALVLSSCGLNSSETNEVSDEARTNYIRDLITAEGAELLYAPQIADMPDVSEEYLEKYKIPTKFPKVSKADGSLNGLTNMYLLMENANYKLYIDFKTTDIALQDLATGNVYHSNPGRDPATDSKKYTTAAEAIYGSPLAVEAYDASGKLYSFNFYANCYDGGSGSFYVVKTAENTLRLIYTIGNDPDKDLFPPVITEETYNNRILKGLADKLADGTITQQQYTFYTESLLPQCYRYMTPKDITLETKERFRETFPTIDVMTLYVSWEGTSTKLKKDVKTMMEIIGFTAKDVKKEMEKADYQGPERAVLYTIPVDITLNDEGLEVNVDASMILGPTKQRLYSINIYRGFGANIGYQNVSSTVSSQKHTDAYMIVPDGSGAIIPVNGYLTTSAYKSRLYGPDGAFAREYSVEYSKQSIVPYLIYDRDNLLENSNQLNGGGLVAILKEGAAQASVVARPISGASTIVASVNYEAIYSERDYRTYSTAPSVAGADNQTGSGLLLSKDDVKGNFRIQYLFTEGGMTYSEYAQYLREYYIKHGLMPAETLQESALPFFVDLLGCVDLDQTFMGIPLRSETALTTYAQAQQILTELKEIGVENVVARYSYWANGGEANSVADEVDLLSCMGSKNDLQALVQYCNENNMGFFPSVEFLSVVSDSGISTSRDAARRMNRSTATLVARNNANGALRKDLEENILLSSKFSAEISATYKVSFEEIFSTKSIALGNLGKDLHSNYRTNEGITRIFAEADHVQILKNFEGYKIAVSTGNFYTWSYASHIFGLPSGSTQYLSQSTAIPFAQMLLHGYVNYSIDPVNQTGDYETALLLILETGAAPSVRWMGAEDSIFDYTSFYNYFSLNYSSTINRAAALYKEAAAVLNDVVNTPISKHEAVDAFYVSEDVDNDVEADTETEGDAEGDAAGDVVVVDKRISSDGGVFATTYGNKKVVIVNYNPFDVELNDGTIVKAVSYKVCTLEEYDTIVNGPAEDLPVVDENNGQEG